jgi:hypothetical protein
LWGEYERECYPYRSAGALGTAPRHEEIEDLRKRIFVHLENARRAKPTESSWDEAIEAAADATQAAELAVELANKLNQCIGTAKGLGRDTRRFRITIAIAVLAIVVAAVVAYTVGDHANPPTAARTVTVRAPTGVPSSP